MGCLWGFFPQNKVWVMLSVFRTERSPLQQEMGKRSMSPHAFLTIKATPIKAHIKSRLWVRICIKLH